MQVNCASHVYFDIINGAGKTIALQCRVCLEYVAFGDCAECKKRAVKLPCVLKGQQFCKDDCAREWRLRQGRAERARKRAEASGPPRQGWIAGIEQGGADLLARARARK